MAEDLQAPAGRQARRKRVVRRGGRQRGRANGRATASALLLYLKPTAQRAGSVREAALSLLEAAIETLSSAQDDESVHAARKACKRVRAALRLLRARWGDAAYRRENMRIRNASKPLTAVRDAFVLQKVVKSFPESPGRLRRALDSEYRAERSALVRRGARNALKQLNAARRRLLGLPEAGSEVPSVIAGAQRVYKAGRKALANARPGEDQALHELRKQAKYLLNQLEIVRSVFNVKFKKLRRRADKLAEVLGDDHDLAVLTGKMNSYKVPRRSIRKGIDKRRNKLQARAFRCAKKLYGRSGRHLAKTMGQRLPAAAAS